MGVNAPEPTVRAIRKRQLLHAGSTVARAIGRKTCSSKSFRVRIVFTSLRAIGVTALIFAVTLLLHWRRKGLAEMKEYLWGGLEGALAAFILFILFYFLHLFVLTPKNMVEESRRRPPPATPKQTLEPLKLDVDVRDAEGRKELEKTREELAKAQETIRALDPLQQRIASATATAEVLVKSDKNDGTSTHTMGGGGSVAFARGTEALLATAAMNATSRTQNSKTTVYLVFNSPIYGPLVGKPLAELATAEYVQLEITSPLGDADAEAEVLGGTIVFTLNGSHRFEFPIPAQATVKKRVFVRDLYQMRSQLRA